MVVLTILPRYIYSGESSRYLPPYLAIYLSPICLFIYLSKYLIHLQVRLSLISTYMYSYTREYRRLRRDMRFHMSLSTSYLDVCPKHDCLHASWPAASLCRRIGVDRRKSLAGVPCERREDNSQPCFPSAVPSVPHLTHAYAQTICYRRISPRQGTSLTFSHFHFLSFFCFLLSSSSIPPYQTKTSRSTGEE